MAHRQLEGCHKQLPHPKGESSQQGEQPAQHPRRQEQGRVVGPEEHAGGAGGGGVGAHQGVSAGQQSPRQKAEQGGGAAHLHIVPQGEEVVLEGPGLPAPDALDHRIVQRRRGRTDGHHGQAQKQPQDGQAAHVHQGAQRGPDPPLGVKESAHGYSTFLARALPTDWRHCSAPSGSRRENSVSSTSST